MRLGDAQRASATAAKAAAARRFACGRVSRLQHPHVERSPQAEEARDRVRLEEHVVVGHQNGLEAAEVAQLRAHRLQQ
eukprot:3958974-Prymnesium_polylepis.1